MVTLEIRTDKAEQVTDITDRVAAVVRENKQKNGAVLVFCPHTTAGVTINEHADPAVMADMQDALRRLVPKDDRFRHSEGNSHAHARALLTGSSVTVIVEDGKMQLGTWQGIFFMEYDGPRQRQIFVQILRGNDEPIK